MPEQSSKVVVGKQGRIGRIDPSPESGDHASISPWTEEDTMGIPIVEKRLVVTKLPVLVEEVVADRENQNQDERK